MGHKYEECESNKFNRAMCESNVDYIRSYVKNSGVDDVINFIYYNREPFNASIDLIRYLIQFRIIKSLLVQSAIFECKIETLELIFKYDINPNLSEINEYLLHLIMRYIEYFRVYVVKEHIPDFKSVALLLIKYYEHYFSLLSIYSIDNLGGYIGNDIQNYIIYNMINKLLKNTTTSSNIKTDKIESLLKTTLKTGIPSDLIIKLLNLLPNDSLFHSQEYRDQFKISKPIHYVSLFEEDV